MTRVLTQAQHSRLDKLADDTEGVVVCGWHPKGGPIVRHDLQYRYVNSDGHLKPVAKEDRP